MVGCPLICHKILTQDPHLGSCTSLSTSGHNSTSNLSWCTDWLQNKNILDFGGNKAYNVPHIEFLKDSITIKLEIDFLNVMQKVLGGKLTQRYYLAVWDKKK